MNSIQRRPRVVSSTDPAIRKDTRRRLEYALVQAFIDADDRIIKAAFRALVAYEDTVLTLVHPQGDFHERK